MAGQPLSPATDRRLGEPLPHQPANQTRGHLRAINLWQSEPCDPTALCGISGRFQPLFPTPRQVPHALLTRPPLRTVPKGDSPFDLHVLSTPPAFILSQDQTLNKSLFNHPISRTLKSLLIAISSIKENDLSSLCFHRKLKYKKILIWCFVCFTLFNLQDTGAARQPDSLFIISALCPLVNTLFEFFSNLFGEQLAQRL